MTAQKRFAAYAWFVLAFAIAVVLWGAGVRATGSGAGCGDQWPLCNGVWLPQAPSLHTIIEFTHRITSGPTLGLFVIALVVFAFRLFPRRHIVRRCRLRLVASQQPKRSLALRSFCWATSERIHRPIAHTRSPFTCSTRWSCSRR